MIGIEKGSKREKVMCDLKNSGVITGWMLKVKSDSAQAKWLSDASWRFFVLDFESRTFYYSKTEAKKNVSNPIAFADILEAQLLHSDMQRKGGLSQRVFGSSETFPFSLMTRERAIRLSCKTEAEARKWVEVLNNARDLVKAESQAGIASSPSQASLSTHPGSEGQPLSDTDSGHGSHGSTAAAQDNHGGYSSAQSAVPAIPWHNPAQASTPLPPPWANPTPEPGSKPPFGSQEEVSGEDAFAALDALADELGPVPEHAPCPAKIDGALKAKAKAKILGQSRISEASELAPVAEIGPAGFHELSSENAPAPEQVPVTDLPKSPKKKKEKKEAPKQMSEEERIARDMALLQRSQAPPLKTTRTLKRGSTNACVDEEASFPKPILKNSTTAASDKVVATPEPDLAMQDSEDVNSWDGDGASHREVAFATEAATSATMHDDDPWDSDNESKPAKSAKGPSFAGPSEGAIDSTSWDDDVPARATRRSGRSARAAVVEDDPTEGLDDLVESVVTGKPSSVAHHQHVPNFQCTQCDFQVIRFQGHAWSPEADYLFFRNFYGKPHKLKRQLCKEEESSAYCCQCAWKSAPSEATLRDVSEGTRWKCIGFA